jgi:Na+/phosphate symporter
MASLKEAAALTEGLERLIGNMREELKGDSVDFQKIVALADEIGERADGIAETFTTLDETLVDRLRELKTDGRSSGSRTRSTSRRRKSSGSRSKAKSGSRS